MNLGKLGEQGLLRLLLPKLPIDKRVIAGAGDDVAVVKIPGSRDLLLLKTDCVVERIHFERDADPVRIGWKAMMRPLSDFAATSGVPRFALVTIALAKERKAQWIKKIYQGLTRAAKRFKVSVVGGETSSTCGPAIISIAVVGFVERTRWISRSGGRVGDDLFVTGRLGGAHKGKHLRFTPRIEEARWLSKNFRIHAMMDLSDGLAADLPRLAQASGVGFALEMDQLPRASGATIENAISDGEDYELLFAISPRQREGLQTRWKKKFPALRITRIGRLLPQSAAATPQLKGGYLHFQ